MSDEIPKVERALARTRSALDEMSDTWSRNRWPCCPGCAFGTAWREKVEKAERQAAWLVVLLHRRLGPSDARRIAQLSSDYPEARNMARRLQARA